MSTVTSSKSPLQRLFIWYKTCNTVHKHINVGVFPPKKDSYQNPTLQTPSSPTKLRLNIPILKSSFHPRSRRTTQLLTDPSPDTIPYICSPSPVLTVSCPLPFKFDHCFFFSHGPLKYPVCMLFLVPLTVWSDPLCGKPTHLTWGVQFTQTCDKPRHVSFSPHVVLKSKVVNILTKSTGLCIDLNIDDTPIPSRSHTHCVNTYSHQTTVLGIYPSSPVLTWRFNCGLLEKQNGINEGFLFLRADLRTTLFSVSSVFRLIFYCPKPVHMECS
jgi:hypothetical protein